MPVYNHRHEQRKKRPRASQGDSVDAVGGDGDSTGVFDGGGGDGVLALVG